MPGAGLLLGALRFLMSRPLLTAGLGALGYGGYKLATSKKPTEKEIQTAVSTALPVPTQRGYAYNPINESLSGVFKSLSEGIRQNAGKLTASDLNKLIGLVSTFTTPLMAASARSTGIEGALQLSRLQNSQASYRQKQMQQQMLQGALSPNQAVAQQYFNPSAIPYAGQ